MAGGANLLLDMKTATGRHFYQFYKGREDFFRFSIPFLRHGLESGEACLWIVSQAIGIAEAIHAFGRECDLELFLDRGQLTILPAEKWYFDRGRFSERKVLQKTKSFVEDKTRLGFGAVRGVGDAGWLEKKDWVPFQEYEERAHQLIQNFGKITAICAYPIQRCSLTQTKDVLIHHDSVFQHKL